MLQVQAKGSLMGCSMNPPKGMRETQLRNGLIRGHAYSVTDVRLVSFRTSWTAREIRLLRVRNPWGNDREWNGA